MISSSFANANDSYVGAKVCASCHQSEFEAWQNSHHDWAMKPANAEFVLANFDEQSLNHFEVESRFYQKDEKYFVETDNTKGDLESFEVLYTFGFYPLQQYLVDIGEGRLQALLQAWDSRPLAEGGQRWFHLYPNEQLPAGDTLHWTGAYFNWNSRCAECHSTNLQRNYDDKTRGYSTTFSEINVACESCHGAGLSHSKAPKTQGLNDLGSDAKWLFKADANSSVKADTALNSNPHGAGINKQIDRCAACHSRRSMISEYDPDAKFLDGHRLSLINPPLYQLDGQIEDEVYVLGSFMQSKMYQKGVTCTNCHDAHSLKLKIPDGASSNGLCAQCHNTETFESTSHHHHPMGSEGAKCVSCHMPETNYMVIDPRRDHSLRIPRPDLVNITGNVDVMAKSPGSRASACENCHEDRAWLKDQFSTWFKGKTLPAAPLLLSQDRQHMMALATDKSQNEIIRATAMSRLALAPDQNILQQSIVNLTEPSPLLRLEAVSVLGLLPAAGRMVYLLDLVDEPVKSVRLEVARLFLDVDYKALLPVQVKAIDGIIKEYKQSLNFHRDTAAGQLNIGLMLLSEGKLDAAVKAYKQAIQIEPKHLGAHLNLADLYRQQEKSVAARELLVKTVVMYPDNADAHHALGLAWVRELANEKALVHLKTASELRVADERYFLVYMVALDSLGRVQTAITAIEARERELQIGEQLIGYLFQLYKRTKQQQKAMILVQRYPDLFRN